MIALTVLILLSSVAQNEQNKILTIFTYYQFDD
jgi:hypothetical protein